MTTPSGHLGPELPAVLAEVSGPAQLIAVQKPFAWEQKLFAQVLRDEMERHSDLKRALERCPDMKKAMPYDPGLGSYVRLADLTQVTDWVQGKLTNITALAQSGTSLLNQALPVAFGPLGKPGNPEHIVFVAKRLGEVYRDLLLWTTECRFVQVDHVYQRLLAAVSKFSGPMISSMENFSVDMLRRLDEYTHRWEGTKESPPLTMNLTFALPDMSEFNRELRRLRRRLVLRGV